MGLRNIAHVVRHPKKAIEEYQAKEKHIVRKKGTDPDNTYYVIRCKLPECGFFAIFMFVLDHLAICEDKGYIPIIDIEQYDTLYKQDEPVNGTTDPWRYYFDPPSGAICGEKYASVILSAIAFPHYKGIYYYRDESKNVLPPAEHISYLNAIMRKYIRFNSEVEKELKRSESFVSEGRFLGIHVRGTDMYTEGKQHPVPTGETKDFSVIDGIMEKHNIDKIFLSSDTDKTVQAYRDYYGDKVVTTDSIRQRDDLHTGIHKDRQLAGRVNHRYLMGMEVIRDMYLLSKCDVLACGPSNVAFAAIIYNNNNYQKIYYFA